MQISTLHCSEGLHTSVKLSRSSKHKKHLFFTDQHSLSCPVFLRELRKPNLDKLKFSLLLRRAREVKQNKLIIILSLNFTKSRGSVKILIIEIALSFQDGLISEDAYI